MTGTNYQKANCLSCNKEFDFYLGNKKGLFCSRECYNKFVAIPKKECVICGKIYTPDKSNKERWDKSKYCSIKCLNESKFKGRYVKCSYCKKDCWKTPYSLKTKKKHFCSKRCYNSSLRGKSTLKFYRKGYKAEHEAIKSLEKEGYIALRNFLSWGTFDIVAIGLNHIRFIQCKSSRKFNNLSIYKKDINNILSYNVPDYATKELWVRVDYQGWKKYLISNKIEKLDEDNLPKTNKVLLIGESLAHFYRKLNNLIIEIDRKTNKVKFIQTGINNEIERAKLLSDYAWLSNEFVCSYEIIGGRNEKQQKEFI